MVSNPNLFNEEVGLLRTGTIVDYSPVTGKMKVQLNGSTASIRKPIPVTVNAPYALSFNNGLFVGTKPSIGTPVVIAQGSGNLYYFVSFIAENPDQVPTLKDDELLLQANNKTKLSLNNDNNIYLGSVSNKLHIDTDFNLLSSNFHNEQHFTQASRQITGIIRRDKKLSTGYDLNSRLENDSYDTKYTVISLDPTVSPNIAVTGVNKNPPFVEKREMIYEFQYSTNISDDLTESQIYSNAKNTATLPAFPNRRKSKADTLSLTLTSPNYLMETVKGTVVDIFGNILDLNRYPLPIGKDQNTLNSDISTDKVASFLKIKELERKSIAYHFEINARKDFSSKIGKVNSSSDLFDLNSNADYSRTRSRFFFDVDKEGQFKLNVPASSEKGNIPLLVRYENYSTISPEDNNNVNKLIFRDDNIDILQDSFAAKRFTDDGTIPTDLGVISIKDGDADGAPIDRIAQTVIKHGTAYHDILNTCYAHQKQDFLSYQYDPDEFKRIDLNSIPNLTNIVSDTIYISGDKANAGGRSGSINFDGMIELNIGANTVDRQSLWADLAGGMVMNVGRDKQSKSAAISMNGDVFIQVGGIGVAGDSRFVKEMNGQIGAVFDLRIFRDGFEAHMIRIDKNGITIMTPGVMNFHAANGFIFSGKSFDVDVETCSLQGRAVIKELAGSI